jgi:hypothetical protein
MHWSIAGRLHFALFEGKHAQVAVARLYSRRRTVLKSVLTQLGAILWPAKRGLG